MTPTANQIAAEASYDAAVELLLTSNDLSDGEFERAAQAAAEYHNVTFYWRWKDEAVVVWVDGDSALMSLDGGKTWEKP